MMMTFQTPAARMSAQPHDWIRWAAAGAGRDSGMRRAGFGTCHVHCGVMRQQAEAINGYILKVSLHSSQWVGMNRGERGKRGERPAPPAWPDALARATVKHVKVSFVVGKCLSASGRLLSAHKKPTV